MNDETTLAASGRDGTAHLVVPSQERLQKLAALPRLPWAVRAMSSACGCFAVTNSGP
jgi:hypothetical protein